MKLLYIAILTIIMALPLHAAEPTITSEPQGSTASAPATAAAGTTIKSGEKLAYNIYFHMGFIWAKAGYGELSFRKETRNGEQRLHGQLAAKSLSIVEHIMKVRDTLDCWFNPNMVPTEFRKGTHEGSYNAIAHNKYYTYWHDKNAANTLANVDSTYVTIERKKQKNKEAVTTESFKFSNKGTAYDMLSVFYSIRGLDYAKMVKGKKLQFVCYDGVKKQTIKMEYRGAEKCELRNEKKYDAYLIHLTFDTKGQEGTPLQVWLSKTPDHHPIKAVIGLKRIGSVQCEINE